MSLRIAPFNHLNNPFFDAIAHPPALLDGFSSQDAGMDRSAYCVVVNTSTPCNL